MPPGSGARKVAPVSERNGEKWAVVLGASSGFGAAVSVELAGNGFDICGVHLDRRSTIENAERTRAAIEEAGRRALFFNVNAADEKKRGEVVDALGNEAREELQKIADALSRMEAGDYGLCSECGTRIAPERIAAYPYAEEGIDCAELAEDYRARP